VQCKALLSRIPYFSIRLNRPRFPSLASSLNRILRFEVLNKEKCLGGIVGVAQAVNASGEVVGYTGVIPYSHAALFASGNVTDLGLLPGGTYTFATDINNNGEVVGVGDLPGGYIHSFCCEASGSSSGF
jgi:probable HAF family extracellular repeat protein